MRLLAVRAVPTPLLALEVQRAGDPGAPGGFIASSFAIVFRLFHWNNIHDRAAYEKARGPSIAPSEDAGQFSRILPRGHWLAPAPADGPRCLAQPHSHFHCSRLGNRCSK